MEILGDYETGSLVTDEYLVAVKAGETLPWARAAMRVTRPPLWAAEAAEMRQESEAKAGRLGTIRKSGSLDSLNKALRNPSRERCGSL